MEKLTLNEIPELAKLEEATVVEPPVVVFLGTGASTAQIDLLVTLRILFVESVIAGFGLSPAIYPFKLRVWMNNKHNLDQAREFMADLAAGKVNVSAPLLAKAVKGAVVVCVFPSTVVSNMCCEGENDDSRAAGFVWRAGVVEALVVRASEARDGQKRFGVVDLESSTPVDHHVGLCVRVKA
ncbi:unnamed protein product [Dovyalis caffra]|uniref:Uncharacterized protein n=1 Tax=Dovyalis caffra TaxID=77055 RepID=A0AAV1SLJ2_9ROSI|nr:unnamed protein product [Dovyalis caffra]